MIMFYLQQTKGGERWEESSAKSRAEEVRDSNSSGLIGY